MSDMMEAAQEALFVALETLEGTPGVPTGTKVYQHVPEDAPPPMIVVGAITSENASEKGFGATLEEITAEVQFIFRGPSRAPLLAMMRAARGVLHGQAITAPGALFEEPRWLKAEATDALEDGVSYFGRQTYKFFAQPA